MLVYISGMRPFQYIPVVNRQGDPLFEIFLLLESRRQGQDDDEHAMVGQSTSFPTVGTCVTRCCTQLFFGDFPTDGWKLRPPTFCRWTICKPHLIAHTRHLRSARYFGVQAITCNSCQNATGRTAHNVLPSPISLVRFTLFEVNL